MPQRAWRKTVRFRGRKGWVQRVPNLTFVLVPRIYDSEREEERVACAACRIAYQHSLMPFYPRFFFGVFVTIEELESPAGKKLIEHWFARCSRIWVACAQDNRWVSPEGLDLDQHAFDVLRTNQACGDARPVSALLSVGANSAHPLALKPEQVDTLVLQNLQSAVAGCL